MSLCSYCKGHGSTACFSCNGSGRRGNMSCSSCSGTGRKKCNFCIGSGQRYNSGDQYKSGCLGGISKLVTFVLIVVIIIWLLGSFLGFF